MKNRLSSWNLSCNNMRMQTVRAVSSLLVAISAVALLASVSACTSSRQRVRASSLDSAVSSFVASESDPLEENPVEYLVTGKGNYDSFFRESAELRGGLLVSETAATSMSKNLKSYARSYAAKQATDDNVKDILGETKPDDMNDEQAAAVMQLKKKRGELSDDELKYATRAGGNALQLGAYLAGAAQKSAVLLETGDRLRNNVQSDFNSPQDAVAVPGILEGLTTTIDNLQKANQRLPDLAKEMARLGETFKALTEG